MAKLQKNSNNGSYWLIAPKSIVEAKGWKKGDEFLIKDGLNGINSPEGKFKHSTSLHASNHAHTYL